MLFVISCSFMLASCSLSQAEKSSASSSLASSQSAVSSSQSSLAGTPGLAYTLIAGTSNYSVTAGTATNGNTNIGIIIPSTYQGGAVTTIGNYAFFNCRDLTNLVLPEGLTTIGDSAFSNCYSLMDLALPGSLTVIGDSAFYDCISLTNLSINATNPPNMRNTNVFSRCISLIAIRVPASSITEYQTANGWSPYLNIIIISNSSLPSTTSSSSPVSSASSSFSSGSSVTSSIVASSISTISSSYSSSSTATSSYITNQVTIYVAEAPSAQTLMQPTYTNVPMIVGNLCGASTNLGGTAVIGSWVPSADIGFMHYVSNINLADYDGNGDPTVSPLYAITLYVPFTSQANQATSYSFVNTTYPDGSSWANQEGYYGNDGTAASGSLNRTFVVTYSNAVQTVWLTNRQANIHNYNSLPDLFGIIEFWSVITPTYTVNCNVHIIMTNVITNDVSNALDGLGPVNVGDEMYLVGSFNGFSGNVLSSNQIIAENNGTVNFPAFAYSGTAGINFDCLYTNENWDPAFRLGSGNSAIIPAGTTDFYITNTGVWSMW